MTYIETYILLCAQFQHLEYEVEGESEVFSIANVEDLTDRILEESLHSFF